MLSLPPEYKIWMSSVISGYAYLQFKHVSLNVLHIVWKYTQNTQERNDLVHSSAFAQFTLSVWQLSPISFLKAMGIAVPPATRYLHTTLFFISYQKQPLSQNFLIRISFKTHWVSPCPMATFIHKVWKGWKMGGIPANKEEMSYWRKSIC